MFRKGSAIVLFLLLLCPQTGFTQGLVSVDTYTPPELDAMMAAGYHETFTWPEAYGEFVDVHGYIPGVTVDDAWEYVQNIYNLAEWTISVRLIRPDGELNGQPRYYAWENMPGAYDLWFLERKDPASRTVDWWVGHAPDDIWMRYFVRVQDAQPIVGKPGVILTWVNFGHDKYWSDPDLYQGFLGMKIAHGIERDNLAKILQWRAAGHTDPLTDADRAQLGLIDLENYDFFTIWMMVMAQITPTVAWEDYYGDFLGNHFILPGVPQADTWDLLSNPYTMEDWTVGLREVKVNGTAISAVDRMAPMGAMRGSFVVYPTSSTIDLQLERASDYAQGDPPVFNSSFRVLDGPETVGFDGSVVAWITYRHIDLLDPSFVGGADYWKYLPVSNDFSAQNIGALLTP